MGINDSLSLWITGSLAELAAVWDPGVSPTIPSAPLCSCLVATPFSIFVLQKHLQTVVRLGGGSTAEHYYPNYNYYEISISGIWGIVQVSCFWIKLNVLALMAVLGDGRKGWTGHLLLLPLETPFSASWIRGVLQTWDDQRKKARGLSGVLI